MELRGNNIITDNKWLVFDDWYNEEELKAVWKEIDFYSQTQELQRANKNLTVTGVDEKGEAQANCYRIYLNSFYTIY